MHLRVLILILRTPFWIGLPRTMSPNFAGAACCRAIQTLQLPSRLGDDAMQAGGSAVADAWMEATAVADDSQLLRALDEAQAAAQSSRQEELPLLARYMKPAKLFYKARQKAGLEGAGSLVETFAMVHAYRPRSCTSQQLTDWRSFLRQLTARKVAKAEPATIKNVIRTIAELHKFQLLRGRAECLLDVGVIDLSAFLESGSGAWSHGASDPLWMPLLGAWLAAVGCIRFGHLENSVVERMTQSTVHCYCKKGKQASRRGGF